MNEILTHLNPIISELQELLGWPMTELPVGLLLYDVLVCLGAQQADLEEILGPEILNLIDSPAIPDVEHTPIVQVC